MSNLERKHFAEMAQKATALQKIWLRERQEQRQAQAATNAAIKQRWVESDSASEKAVAADQLADGDEPISQRLFSDPARKENRS